MLSYEQCHTPEDIEELKINIVESVREALRERVFQFIRTSTIPEQSTTSTIGYCTVGLPDIVFGTNLTSEGLPFWEDGIIKLQKYMVIYGVPELGESIDPIQFANFGALADQPPVTSIDELPVGNKEIRLVRIDSERWFAGEGWQHALYYTEQERKDAIVMQWLVPDSCNRYPTDVGYAGPHQAVFEALPFGQRWPNDQTPERIARNRYMH